MKILIAYATRYGSTRQIAHWMAERAVKRCEVDVSEVGAIENLDAYSHVIIGSPLYDDDILPEAREFITNHASALKDKYVGAFGVALGHYGKGLYGNPEGAMVYLDRFDSYLPTRPVYAKLLGGELNPELLNEEDYALLKEFWEIKGKSQIPYEQRADKKAAWDFLEKFVSFSETKKRLDKRLK